MARAIRAPRIVSRFGVMVMAAWTVTAEKGEGQLTVRVSGPSAGPAQYKAELLFKPSPSGPVMVMASKADMPASGFVAALPLAVTWAQDVLTSWRTGLGA